MREGTVNRRRIALQMVRNMAGRVVVRGKPGARGTGNGQHGGRQGRRQAAEGRRRVAVLAEAALPASGVHN
jgi:hypothetical protein